MLELKRLIEIFKAAKLEYDRLTGELKDDVLTIEAQVAAAQIEDLERQLSKAQSMVGTVAGAEDGVHEVEQRLLDMMSKQFPLQRTGE